MLSEAFEKYNLNILNIDETDISVCVKELLGIIDSLSTDDKVLYIQFIDRLFKLKYQDVINYDRNVQSKKRDMKFYYLNKAKNKALYFLSKKRKKYRYHLVYADDIKEIKSVIRKYFDDKLKYLNKKSRTLLETLMAKKWNVDERAKTIENILYLNPSINFNDTIETGEKEEIVIDFAALLNLMKEEKVSAYQERNFGNITIKKR